MGGRPPTRPPSRLNGGVVDVLYSWPYFAESLRDTTHLARPFDQHWTGGCVDRAGAVWAASEAWIDDNAGLATDFCAGYGDLIHHTLGKGKGNGDDAEQMLTSKNSIPAHWARAVLEAALKEGRTWR